MEKIIHTLQGECCRFRDMYLPLNIEIFNIWKAVAVKRLMLRQNGCMWLS